MASRLEAMMSLMDWKSRHREEDGGWKARGEAPQLSAAPHSQEQGQGQRKLGRQLVEVWLYNTT